MGFSCCTGGNIDQWLARSNSSVISWYLSDRLGSITGITDATGKLINSTTYDWYGHITSQSNPSVADQFAFTGREYEPETGLYYFRARYYNPDLGRFQSEDPTKFNAGDFNLAWYCLNSPNRFLDRTGKNPADERAETQSYLFRGTTKGYGGKYEVSPTSTSPLVAFYFAEYSEASFGARGVIFVLNRAEFAGVESTQTNAIAAELEMLFSKLKLCEIPELISYEKRPDFHAVIVKLDVRV